MAEEEGVENRIKFKIRLINVQGLTDDKVVDLSKLMKKEDTLLCLTETHHKFIRKRFNDKYKQIEKFRGDNEKKGGGLMVVYSEKNDIEIQEREVRNNDIMCLDVKLGSDSFKLLLVYLDVKDKEINSKIKQTLFAELEQLKMDEKFVLLGDFNAHLGFLGQQHINWNGKMVLDIMEKGNLVLLNGVEECSGEITRSQRGEESAIDFVLFNQNMFQKFCAIEIDEGKELFDLSDHCLLTVTIDVNRKKNNFDKKCEKQIIEYYKLNSEELKSRFLNKLEEDINENKHLQQNTMQDLDRAIKENAEKILKKTIIRRSKVENEKAVEPIWFNADIAEKIKKRREYNRKKRYAETNEQREYYWNMYKESKQEARNAVREAKEAFERKITDEIKRDKNSNSKWWDQIRKLRCMKEKKDRTVHIYEENGEQIRDEEQSNKLITFWNNIYRKRENTITEHWNEHKKRQYVEYLSNKPSTLGVEYGREKHTRFFPKVMEVHIDALGGELQRNGVDMKGREIKIEFFTEQDKQNIPIHLKEHFEMVDCIIRDDTRIKYRMQPFEIDEEKLKKQLTKVKNGKSTGPDGLKGEIYKWMGERKICTEALVEAFNEVIGSGMIPLSWKESKTVLTPKVSKPKVKDFRPIALTNSGYKIFMGLAKENIVRHLELNDQINEMQAGFTKGRRLEDNLFILKYCVESAYKNKEILCVVVIDFAKAFDSVDRGKMIETLMEYECDPEMIASIAQLYTGDKTEIWLDERRMGETEVTTGIRQGCTGSPQLFIMVVNKLIEKIVETKLGFKTDLYIPTLFFADDGLLITTSLGAMEVLIDLMIHVARKSGLEINLEKCKCMIFNMKENLPCKVKGIQVVEEIKYLGVQITNDRNCFGKYKKEKIKLARKLMNLTYTVFSNSSNRLIIGKTYWKNVALPSILHGSQVIVWNKVELETLQKIENNVWRHILGASGHTPVVCMQGDIGSSSVETRDMKAKLGYIEHLKEGGNLLGKEVMKRIVTGDLYKKWIKVTEDYLQRVGMQEREELWTLKRGELKTKIDEYEHNRWRSELEQRMTVSLYARKKNVIKEESRLYSNDFRSQLLFKMRSNTLNLNWRKRFQNEDTGCSLCRQGEESLEHFLITCREYGNIRNEFGVVGCTVERLLGFEQISKREIENYKSYIEKIWRKRKQMMA